MWPSLTRPISSMCSRTRRRVRTLRHASFIKILQKISILIITLIINCGGGSDDNYKLLTSHPQLHRDLQARR